MKHVFLALSVIAILTSCDRDDNFPGQPNPHASIKEFIVPMNFYLEKADVDSAIAKWQTGTTTQTIKLNFRNDTLFSPLAFFAPGAGRMTLNVKF